MQPYTEARNSRSPYLFFLRLYTDRVLTFQRLKSSFTEEERALVCNDPNMHYHVLEQLNSTFLLEQIFGMYRRMMIGAIVDARFQIIAIVLTAIEEAILRSTMVFRDTLFAKLSYGKDWTDAELANQRRVWAASSASSMYIELVSIITARVMYVTFYSHRFVVNFGYSSAATTGVATMVVAAFGELLFEVIVDAFAVHVESRNGINLGEFWSMWRKNPGKSCALVRHSLPAVPASRASLCVSNRCSLCSRLFPAHPFFPSHPTPTHYSINTL